jgi:hypothetical protein
MARDLSEHNPMSLDVVKHSTSLMRELQVLTPDVVKEQLREILAANNIVFFTSKQAQQLMDLFAKREANSTTHLFTGLGYKKNRFAWGGDKSQKACWYLPSAAPERGEVLVGGIRVPMALHLEKVDNLLTTPFQRIDENSLTKQRQHETNDGGTVSQFLRVDEDF